MAYHQRHRSSFGDTTYTKVFVGGLAWETPTEKMSQYFKQFGEILEAVIIIDKSTGKSKGYGFVTFREPESARQACAIANPVIDGRRANCNIASFGRPRPLPPRGRNHGQGDSSSPSFGQVPAVHQTPQALPTPTPFFYQPYGYTTFTPSYDYHQITCNPQLQRPSQCHYPQFYGSSLSSSLGTPYADQHVYSRGSYSSPSAHSISGPSYVYYPTQMEGGPTNPYAPFPSPPSHLPPPTVPLPESTGHQFPSTAGSRFIEMEIEPARDSSLIRNPYAP